MHLCNLQFFPQPPDSWELTRSQSWASQCAGQFRSPQGWMARGLVSAWHWDSGTTRPSLVLQYTCLMVRPCPQLPLHCRRGRRGCERGSLSPHPHHPPGRAAAPRAERGSSCYGNHILNNIFCSNYRNNTLPAEHTEKSAAHRARMCPPPPPPGAISAGI